MILVRQQEMRGSGCAAQAPDGDQQPLRAPGSPTTLQDTRVSADRPGTSGGSRDWGSRLATHVPELMNDSQSKSESPANPVAMTDLAQLAGALAHEIKNPLSVIRLNVELLEEDFESMSTPEARRAIRKMGTVKRQCTRLENLLNDFLQFTRLGSLTLNPGNLNDQLEQVLEFYEPTAQHQNVDVIRYLEPGLPYIMLDSSTLQAALLNLVKNALEAMPDGGRLEVRTRTTLKGVAVDLIDTGCGMDDVTLFNMFENFYSNKHGGTGLGLPTARKIIEAHGGLIEVQSAVDRGTKFSLHFPVPKRI